jgi:membrane-bound metal-dependent hydrolase YbcI (DUF457 family)
MMGPTHTVVGGSTAFVITSALGLPWGYVGIATTCAAMGSPLPDVDQKIKGLKHRTITHYPALQLGFFALVGLAATRYVDGYDEIVWLVVASLTLGCVMHSCADAMTIHPRGIRLLWPISRRGYHLLPWSMRVKVASDSRSEAAFVAIWGLFVLIYAYAHFHQLISA